MPIRTDPSLTRSIRSGPGSVALQVDAAPPDVAVEALRRARATLLTIGDSPAWKAVLEAEGLPGIKYVSEVAPTGSGARLWLNAPDLPPRLLAEIPNVVKGHLSELGVRDALLTVPPPSRLITSSEPLRTLAPAVTLRLYPDPPWVRRGVPSPIPDGWLDVAWAWLRAERPDLDSLTVLNPMLDQPLAPADAPGYLRDSAARHAAQDYLLAGPPDRRIASVGVYFKTASLALTVAGPDLRDGDLEAVADRMRKVAEELAPQLSLGFMAVLEMLGSTLGASPPGTTWTAAGGAGPSLVRGFTDEVVFDAYPFQVLGPGHRRRLEDLPPGAVELPAGRFAAAFGGLEEWLPDSPTAEAIRDRARAVLAPCLVTESEVTALFSARWPRSR
jgi:hypothetical protein